MERANGVEPSRASLATMPRTMRARVIGSCRRICTCCLRLIRSVLICMSFADEMDWSGRQDLHLRLPGSRPGCLLLTYALTLDDGGVNGRDGRTRTCIAMLPRHVVNP